MGTIQLKRSNTAGNTPPSLADGEVAINQADGVLFARKADGTVRSLLKVDASNRIVSDAGAMTVTETGGTQKSLPDAFASKVGLTSPVVFDSTTLTAQLKSRFQDPLDLYGFVDTSFDGSSTPVDNHDVLATILTTAGRKCFLPTGRAYVGSVLPTITNKSVVLHGLGRGETLVFADGVSGLNINQANYTNRTDIRGISFETLGKETGGFAITVAYSDADAVINTNQRRGKFADLTFAGFTLEQQGWVGGIDVYNPNGFEFENVSGYGRIGTTAEVNAAKSASSAAGGTTLDQNKAGLAASKFNMKRLIRLRTGNTYGVDLAPCLPPFITRVRSGSGPLGTGLQTRSG